ncbi:MAG TPA: hypothetical protein VGA73_05205 [Candidatus Binatia bacterium]
MLFRASTNPEMWKFKCQNCGDTFDVELTPGQRAVEFARDKTCPNCHKSPANEEIPWHLVVGFRSVRPAAPN